jgi:hypothetical protein
VDNRRTGLIILLLGNPHLLEGGEGAKNGSSNPDGVFALRRRNNFNLHGGGCESSDFLLQAIGDARVHGRATRQHDVGVEILADVQITAHDRAISGLMDTLAFHTEERGLEKCLRAAETLVADGDDLAVGKFVRLLEGAGGGGGRHFLLKVQGNVAQLFLDVAHDFSLGGGGERVAALGQDLHQPIGEVATGQVQTLDCVGESVS